MAHKIFLFNFFILPVFLATCNSIEPPPPPPDDKPTITLELDDAQCTEAWILFKSTKLQIPNSITLKQYNPSGDSIGITINLTTADTLLYIDSLLPNQTYTFQSYYRPINQSEVKSNVLSVTTMDTTSHSFSWQMFTFGGEIGSSVLFDVAIINENDIWAVGEIWIVDDTSSLGYTKYNAVHWDGSEWELMEILYGGFVVPITSIWSFNENDIWFGVGYLIHWNGIEFTEVTIPNWNVTINSIWGISSNDLYVVGNTGNIAHHNGTSWSRLESGTELNINDIWGDYNDKTKEWEILAVCGNILHGSEYERAILQITNGNQVHQLSAEGANWPLRTVWFLPSRKYYVAGSGIYEKRLINQDEWENDIFEITTYSINRLRGKLLNDVVAAGGGGEVLHFNGVTWKSYINEAGLNYGNYYSITIKDNLIAVVGVDAPSAAITIGRR